MINEATIMEILNNDGVMNAINILNTVRKWKNKYSRIFEAVFFCLPVLVQ